MTLNKHELLILKELLAIELRRNYVIPDEYREYRKIYLKIIEELKDDTK